MSDCLGASELRAEFLYAVEFNRTNLNSRRYLETSPQYAAPLTGTQIELSKGEDADAGSGVVSVYSSFYVTGNFTISIRGYRGPDTSSTTGTWGTTGARRTFPPPAPRWSVQTGG